VIVSQADQHWFGELFEGVKRLLVVAHVIGSS
jgi:thymidine kinase